ncbi:hypothetical protein IMSAGC014_01533 [Bacteroidaceae bacterium]|nr:hypothetical protein IMSAGC014_01533 [Bacteroidaceae bacterium]
MVLQHFKGEIAQILVAYGFQKINGIVPVAPLVVADERKDVGVVAATFFHERADAAEIQLLFLTESSNAGRIWKTLHIVRSDGVFPGFATVVLGYFLFRKCRQVIVSDRRRDVEFLHERSFSGAVGQLNPDNILLPDSQF